MRWPGQLRKLERKEGLCLRWPVTYWLVLATMYPLLVGCGGAKPPETAAESTTAASKAEGEITDGASAQGEAAEPKAPSQPMLVAGADAGSLSATLPPPTGPTSLPALTVPAPGGAARSSSTSSNPVVQVDTNFGSFQIELDRQKAPITVENFLGYVERGAYDQTIVHQIFPRAVIVAGGFKVGGEPIKQGPPIFNEAHNGLKNTRGTVAMYRQPDDPHSATSMFFINVKDNPAFDSQFERSNPPPGNLAAVRPEDYGYCVFGRVIQGMDVVDKIANVPVQDTGEFECTPVEPVIIRSIRWIR